MVGAEMEEEPPNPPGKIGQRGETIPFHAFLFLKTTVDRTEKVRTIAGSIIY
jgi:hypothetical protein